MRKARLSFLLAAVLVISAHASGKLDMNSGAPASPVRIAALAGPSGIGMAKLIDQPPVLPTGAVCEFQIAGSVDVLLPKLLNGDVDIGILPPNVAAKLYNVSPNSIQAAAVVGNDMISLVTRDRNLSGVGDLAGKTVSVAGQGATPEYVLRALLSAQGVDSSAVTLDFSIPTPEIAGALAAGKISYALLPEPFATVAVLNGKNGENPVLKAINIRSEWQKAGFSEDFPMTLCVVRSDFAAKNPESLRAFLDEYRKSIEWTVANSDGAGTLAEKTGLGLKELIAAKSIPASNFVFLNAELARPEIERLLKVFLEYAPASIGGKLPDEGFYFK